jgi:hypothetical protein
VQSGCLTKAERVMKDDWQGRLTKFIFLTPMEWDKKIPLGRQDLQD